MANASSLVCNICASEDFEIIYHSPKAQGLTSLCQLRPGKVELGYCKNCGHLSTNALKNVEAFYENEYKILVDSEDEDQIYEAQGDQVIYRTDHQLRVFSTKTKTMLAGLTDRQSLKVLDYGCAKADMSRKLKDASPETEIHLFDVSKSYLPFWDKLTDEAHWAIYETPEAWSERFDMVMSFFAFEHIPDPAESAWHVVSLLKPGGIFYCVVPNVFGNIADFIVSDHVNHFTPSSMQRLLSDAGLVDIDIDLDSHRGAMVVHARKSSQASKVSPVQTLNLQEERKLVLDIAEFWHGIGDVITNREAEVPDPAAIYGSGFYGAYIYSQLARPESISCFLDRNPFQQGKKLFGVPIVAPEELPGNTRTLYIGLNPAIAREAIQGMPEISASSRELVFLT